MDIAKRDLLGNAKAFMRELKDDDVPGLAAELAYRFFLALFPFLLFLAALGGLLARAAGVENPAQQFLDTFGDALPADAASVVRTQVSEVVDGSNGGLLSVSILGAIWAASSGVGSLMKAINRAYDIPESRPFWKKTAISLGLTIVGGLAILLAITATVVGQVAISRVADEAGMGRAVELGMQVARWPLALLVMLSAIGIVYWAAPNTKLPFKWFYPTGAKQEVRTPKFGKYFAQASVIAGDSAAYQILNGSDVLLIRFWGTSPGADPSVADGSMINCAGVAEPENLVRRATSI